MKIKCNTTPDLFYCNENGVYLTKEDLYHKKPYLKALFTLTYCPIPELSEQVQVPVIYDPESEIMKMLPLMIEITESDKMHGILLAIFKEYEPQIAPHPPMNKWYPSLYSDFGPIANQGTTGTTSGELIIDNGTTWTYGGFVSDSSTI